MPQPSLTKQPWCSQVTGSGGIASDWDGGLQSERVKPAVLNSEERNVALAGLTERPAVNGGRAEALLFEVSTITALGDGQDFRADVSQ